MPRLLAVLIGLLLLRAPLQEAPPAVRGDVTRDGQVTSADGLGILSGVVGKSLPEDWILRPYGDADCDGAISSLDALLVLQHIVERDVSQYCIGSAFEADLLVSKTVADSLVFEGDTVTFTVTVTNLGPDTARDVQLLDSAEIALERTAFEVSDGDVDEVSGAWSLAKLAPDSTQTATLRFRVDSGTVADTLTNRAYSVGGGIVLDPDASNDTASAFVMVGQKTVDLVVTKTVDEAAPFEGDSVTYTVVVENLGPDSARNVVVFDTLGAGQTEASSAVTSGVFAARTWTLGDLAPGAVDSLVLVAAIDSGTVADTLTNRAGVVGLTNAVETDPASDTASAFVMVGQKTVDLVVTKTVDEAAPNVGDTVTFTITVVNGGLFDAFNVWVRDSLSAELDGVGSAVSQGTDLLLAADSIWQVGTLQPGDNATATITAVATVLDTLGNAFNRAWVDSLAQAVELDPASDTAQVNLTIGPAALDLVVTKEASDTLATLGDTVTFTVTVVNAGPAELYDATLVDSLAAGIFGFLGDSASQGTTAAAAAGRSWSIGPLAAGDTATFFLEAELVAVDTLGGATNGAWISALDPRNADTAAPNDTAAVTLTVAGPDLSITKTVDQASPAEGEHVTFEVIATNAGPVPLTGVEVHDSLPDGVTFVSASETQGTYTPASGVWTIGSLAAGAADTLLIEVAVDAGASAGTVTNRANRSATDQGDIDAANDTATADVTPTGADYLAVTKSASNVMPAEGETFTYTVTAAWVGPGESSAVTVRDTLPSGLTLVGDSATAGAYDPEERLWTVGSMTAGDTVRLFLTVVPDLGTQGDTLVNRAWAAVPLTDTVPTNDSASAVVTVAGADYLLLEKSVADSTLIETDTATYTLRVVNLGVTELTGVTVLDTLPAGLTFVSATESQGNWLAATHQWDVGTLALGDTATLVLHATVDSGTVADTLVNRGWASSDFPDTVAANDSASAEVVIFESINLSVAKTVSVSNVGVGGSFSFDITVANADTVHDATGVEITDVLPAGVTIDSVFGPGSWDTENAVWSLGTLGWLSSVQSTLFVTLESGAVATTLVNSAHVSGLDQLDVVPSNDTATASFVVGTVDLRVEKDVSVLAGPFVDFDTTVYFDTLTWRVEVHNDGTLGVTGVTVRDVLPSGIFLQSTSVSGGAQSGGSFDLQTGIWSIGPIDPGGDFVRLDITAEVTAGPAIGDTLVNTAYITEVDQTDETTANDTATAEAEILRRVDLSVSKTVSDDSVRIGQTFDYSISVTNNEEGGFASSVRLQDLLPSNVSINFVEAEGFFDDSTGVWTLDTLAASNQANSQVNVTLQSGNVGDVVTNSLHVVSFDQIDRDFTNDTAVVDFVIVPDSGDVQVSVSSQSVMFGPYPDSVVYNIRAGNVGNDPLTNVELVDTVPVGMLWDPGHVSVDRGTVKFSVDSTVLTWTIDTLFGGETFHDVFVIANYAELLAQEDTLVTRVRLVGMDQVDTIPGNNIEVDTTVAFGGGQQQDAPDFAMLTRPGGGAPAVVQPPHRERPFRSRMRTALH